MLALVVVPFQHLVSYFVGNLATSPVLRAELESPLPVATLAATHGCLLFVKGQVESV